MAMNIDSLYTIRHKKTRQCLEKGSIISWCGKVRFIKTINPKLFFTLETAKQALEMMEIVCSEFKAKDFEIVNTHNSINQENWTIEK